MMTPSDEKDLAPPSDGSPSAASAQGLSIAALSPAAQRCLACNEVALALMLREPGDRFDGSSVRRVSLDAALHAQDTTVTETLKPLALPHMILNFEAPSRAAQVYWGADQVVGSVALFDALRPSTAWLDVSCVVRVGGRDHVIPLNVEAGVPWEDVDEEEGLDACWAQSVDERGAAPRAGADDAHVAIEHLLLADVLPTGIALEDLCEALGDPRRAFCACEYAGLGVVVVFLVAIDGVDAQKGEGL